MSNIKQLFSQRYDRESWLAELQKNIHKIEIFSREVLVKQKLVDDFYYLGIATLSCGTKLGIYEVRPGAETQLHKNRVGMRNLVAKQCEKQGYNGALAVYHNDKAQWRFSFISIGWELQEGKLTKTQTPTRRYTYLLGVGRNTRTVVQRFETISKKSNLKALQEAFSVEPLTKEFYQKLSAWYERAKTRVEFPNDEDIDTNEHIKNSLIRLITRLLFVWFIKEKELINEKFFDLKELPNIIDWNKNSSYYKAILQNLFFATLNREIEDREFRKTTHGKANPTNYLAANNYRYQNYFRSKSEIEIIKLFVKSPFLNGGLFACLDRVPTNNEDKDYDNDKKIRPHKSAIRIDGFSDRLDNKLIVDNDLFFNEDENELGLINLLHQYQFTTEESTPVDIEVALDPELLGKVFENLLASYNPETGEQARKATGSFYTPREIVGYMVDESLKQHFKQNIGLTDQKLGSLFDESDSDEGALLSDAEKEKTIAAISTLKVLDPAVGSGAFPMGILQRIVGLLEKLDPENKKWEKQQIDNLPELESIKNDLKITEKIGNDEARTEATTVLEKMKGEIEDLFKKQDTNYLRKLHLIQNSIFGVDIQPIACQIAKLRFFISLAIEQKANSDKSDNYGIKPLPNLETKFIAADTLIGLSLSEDMFTESAEIKRLKDEIQKNRAKHFNASTRKVKMNCTDVDEKLRTELAEEWKSNYQKNAEWVVAKRINNNATNTMKSKRSSYIQKIDARKQALLFEDINPKQVQLSDEKVNQLTEKINAQEELAKQIEARDEAIRSHAIWKQVIAEVVANKIAIAGDAKKIADWNPYDQNAKADWFDAGFMFGVNDDFDVVIGNPPYIQLQKNGGRLGNLYKNCHFESFVKSGDIYQLFYERGHKLLSKNGHLCLITSNKWMRAGYGAKMRNYLATKTQPLKLLDLGPDIFESAMVDTNILLVGENSTAAECVAGTVIKQKGTELVLSEQQTMPFPIAKNGDAWAILSAIERQIKEKIEKVGTPLKEWDININYGVKTGCNEAFIIDNDTKDALIAADAKSAEILKPILRGRDIKRYQSNWAGKWVIATFPSLRLDIENYPEIKQHLLLYGREKLEQEGNALLDGSKSRKKTPHAWFELQDTCAYHAEFEREKIIYSEIVQKPQFHLINGEYFPEATNFILTGENLKILLGVFNSRCFSYIFKRFYSGGGLGQAGYRYKKIFFEKTPIPLITDENRLLAVKIEKKVDSILVAKKQFTDISALEIQLNQMVCELYELTLDEIEFIEVYG